MAIHTQPLSELLEQLHTNEHQGLSAEQAAQHLSQFGPNRLKEKKKKGIFARFFDQFKDVMILILLAAAVVSFILIAVEGNWGELFEPLLIVLIVILNAVMGVSQEGKAE